MWKQINILLASFSHQFKLILFFTSLSDTKSPQESRTLLNILAHLNNAAIYMTSTCPPISNSTCPRSKTLVTGSIAPITIRITVTFTFHCFFVLLQGLRYCVSFCFLWFSFWGALERQKSTIWQVLCLFDVFFLLIFFIVFYEIFTPMSVDALLLKSKGQQIFSSLQNPSQYPGQS